MRISKACGARYWSSYLLVKFISEVLITKQKKAHNICETLVKPSALTMVQTVLGEESERKLMAIPSSDNTVKKRTALVANDMKVQVVTGVEKS